MDIKPIEQIDVTANVALVENIVEYLATLTDKKEEDTEDFQELNFEDN